MKISSETYIKAHFKNFAVIDLGTNTFQLLICLFDKQNQKYTTKEFEIPVMLGENLNDSKIINNQAIERGIQALKTFQNELEKFQIDHTTVIATSAFRNSINGNEFANIILNETKFQVEIIDGLTESNLIALGVQNTVPQHIKDYWIMDIGGGSIEFIYIQNNQQVWNHSFEIGAARLKKLYHINDPITQDEINRISLHLFNELKELPLKKYTSPILVGSAGSFITFLQLAGISNSKNFVELSTKQMNEIYQHIISSSKSKMLTYPFIHDLRAEMIPTASIITQTVINLLQIKQLYISSASLKEGIMTRQMNQIK